MTVERLLATDLDDWTRRVVRRHFDPDLGTPFWLKQHYSFDPLDIERYDDLVHFGPFPIDELRTLDPADLVPRAVLRPIVGRIWDTGGTTGDPCRVYYTEAMQRHAVEWRRWSLQSDGFEPGRTWLQATPGGPHRIGNEALELTELCAARVYGVDIDPRWVKRLIRTGRTELANEYTRHVLEQIDGVLRTQTVDYINTTPALFRALIREYPDHVARLRGARLGGTQISPAMYREFRAALRGGPCGLTYGNTLGCAAGLPASDDVQPYVPNYPQVTMAVVKPDDWTQTVHYGQTGQVRLTVLHEDLFLPNVLERDEAVRHRLGDGWPCDGVANVRPLRRERSAPEGIY